MRFLFNVVIGVFVLWGLVELIGSIGLLLGISIAGEAGPGALERKSNALEGLGFGLVYMITAFGLLKRSPLSRGLAMVLVIWNFLGAASNLYSNPGIVNLLWLSLTIFVPIVVFSGPIHAEFAAAKAKRQTA